MSISRRNNRALNRVLRDSLRAREQSEPPPQETPAYTLCADIPESYDDSYVRAIPKDPQNTFVYWELPKGRAEGSLFADKGTAHVGNDEAVRIGQQLSESRKQRQTENRYCENQWDNGNHYNFDGGSQQHHHNVDNYHLADNDYRQINWDNGNNYNFDGGDRRHHHNVDNCQVDNYQEGCHGYHQINWDNGNNYNFYDGSQQHYHNVDNYHQADNDYRQINWDNGNNYRRNDVYQHIHELSQNLCGMISAGSTVMPDLIRHPSELQEITDQARNDGDANIIKINERLCRVGNQYDWKDDAAFSEMLSALIDRCNRYIADYRQSGNTPSARALSSGLLCGASGEPCQ